MHHRSIRRDPDGGLTFTLTSEEAACVLAALEDDRSGYYGMTTAVVPIVVARYPRRDHTEAHLAYWTWSDCTVPGPRSYGFRAWQETAPALEPSA